MTLAADTNTFPPAKTRQAGGVIRLKWSSSAGSTHRLASVTGGHPRASFFRPLCAGLAKDRHAKAEALIGNTRPAATALNNAAILILPNFTSGSSD